MIQFTDDCLLGIELLDSEHRHLFDLVNRGLVALENEYGQDLYHDIKRLFKELDDYAEQHFDHEEAYMQSICDPELILQRPQHMVFREKILEFLMKNIDQEDNQEIALENLVSFLAKWLYHHVIGSDTMIGKLPPLEEWMLKENPCEFGEEYLLGVDLIDREHRILFGLGEQAYKIVKNWANEPKYEELAQVIDELAACTKSHFEDEEEYMLAIGYDGYEVHKRAHDAFSARLDEIYRDQIAENTDVYLQSLIQFLLGWLTNHILKMDKLIPLEEGVQESKES